MVDTESAQVGPGKFEHPGGNFPSPPQSPAAGVLFSLSPGLAALTEKNALRRGYR